jgi:phenylalanyl-tRNA synthetase beta chain
MLVSWNWLSQYVDIPVSHAELTDRLSLSGLNHESSEVTQDDVLIDLEVTSNRGDCLSHLGVAREIGAIYQRMVRRPSAEWTPTGPDIESLTAVENQMPAACTRYTARVVRGIRVGPSPDWLADRLRAVGVAVINNVVDVTNWVLLECGQPLHAFDLAKLRGGRISVRPAHDREAFQAIDHRTYLLNPQMCVIADRDRAVAIAGVMGGADTEVTESTRDVLIEAAIFAPRSVRHTARALKLHSPSSHRFERRVDPEQLDWASRRACDLIRQFAGGEIASGVIDLGEPIQERKPITLRVSAVERLLGITIDSNEIARILSSLGCEPADESTPDAMVWSPPPWRHDLEREVDLIEEVARIHGYEEIPADRPVPVISSRTRLIDEQLERVRMVMSAAGADEAMTPSVVTQAIDELWSPWTSQSALQTDIPLLEGAQRLRRSLIPSLLGSRRANRAASQADAELYEIARIYLPAVDPLELPAEPLTIGLVSGRSLLEIKGLIEGLMSALHVDRPLDVQVDPLGGAHRLSLGDQSLGYFGQVSNQISQQLKLDRQTTYFEIALQPLFDAGQSVPQFRPISLYPAMHRDLNLVMDEAVTWGNLAATIKQAAGTDLTGLEFREIYRDPKRDGDRQKRVLFTLQLQRPDRTLTGLDADRIAEAVIAACQKAHGARLLAS